MNVEQDFTPKIMGIVNVTPDSFSDGGEFLDHDKAIAHGLMLAEQGADILDIGGESTRPGASSVSVDVEIDRVIPVISALKNSGCSISIDTKNAKTMRAALDAGADIINDVTALEGDPQSLEVVSQSNANVCLMHMKGTPQSMQQNPEYEDVVSEVKAYLSARVESCLKAGIDQSRIVIDPGIGFGKNLEHNLSLIKHIGDLKSIGCPILLGASRKRFIEMICPDTQAKDRCPGSIAAMLFALEQGVEYFRVHDVAQSVQAIKVFRAIAA